jgi:hypothetical protein
MLPYMLAGLAQYIGKGYRITEVRDMLDNRYVGYGTRMRLEGKLEGERKGKLEGEAERRRLEQENERLRREIEELRRRQQSA